MVNTQFDNLWPWLRMKPEEEPPGFSVGGDAADSSLANNSFGLSNWRPPASFLPPPWLEVESQYGHPSFRLGAGVGDSIPANTSVGMSNWRPPFPAQQSTEDNASGSFGLSNWRPPQSSERSSGIGFRLRPDGSINEAETGHASPFDSGVQPPEPQSWWSRAVQQAGGFEGASNPYWPGLRAKAGHDWPAIEVNADASTREAGTPVFDPLSFAAPPSAPQSTSENAPPDASTPPRAATTSIEDLRPAAAGVMAGVANAATAGGAPGSQAVGEVLSRVAGFAGRAAPAAAGAASAAVGALPFLVIPTNTQSEIIDLEDGVRARISPGQRTVEIERRVGTGLLGTDIGARWERLPVEAERRVGKDGAATLSINQEQLRQALSPTGDRDAVTSEMARRPDKGKVDSRPAPGIGHNSGEAPDPKDGRAPDPKNNKTPDPNDGSKPSIWDHVLASTFKILRKGRQEKSVDEERIDTCRKVMKGIGQPAPWEHAACHPMGSFVWK